MRICSFVCLVSVRSNHLRALFILDDHHGESELHFHPNMVIASGSLHPLQDGGGIIQSEAI